MNLTETVALLKTRYPGHGYYTADKRVWFAAGALHEEFSIGVLPGFDGKPTSVLTGKTIEEALTRADVQWPRTPAREEE